MSRVGIIGAGAFGTAMACVLRRSGHDVVMWAREREVVDAINASGTNPLFLSGVTLLPGIAATDELAGAIDDRDFILTAVPAQHVREVTTQMRPFVKKTIPVVSCSKGLERETCALMPEVLAQTLPHATVAVLSGPSFAREIANDLPCGVVLACADRGAAQDLARSIASPRFCVHPSQDVIGAAIGGVMKNIIGIASGIAAGLRFGDNARSTLVTYGLAETMRLGFAKGAQRETFGGLAGIGDLMLTANSFQSRNTSLGLALGERRKLEDVLSGRREVFEGLFSVEAVAALARSLGLEMPITDTLDKVLNHGAKLDAAISSLLARLAKSLSADPPSNR